MKDVQCYELFRGIALKNHASSFHLHERLVVLIIYYVVCFLFCVNFSLIFASSILLSLSVFVALTHLMLACFSICLYLIYK